MIQEIYSNVTKKRTGEYCYECGVDYNLGDSVYLIGGGDSLCQDCRDGIVGEMV